MTVKVTKNFERDNITVSEENLVTEIPDDEKQNVKYHVNTCYSR